MCKEAPVYVPSCHALRSLHHFLECHQIQCSFLVDVIEPALELEVAHTPTFVSRIEGEGLCSADDEGRFMRRDVRHRPPCFRAQVEAEDVHVLRNRVTTVRATSL